MRVLYGFVLVLAATQSVAGEDCPDFEVSSAYLERHFCEQLRGIMSQTGQDRSGWLAGEEPPEGFDTAPWRQIGVLDEAYSRDPKKTLALIERVKAAGGLAEN
jgi:hypothetical protein